MNDVAAIHCPLCSEWTAEKDWEPDIAGAGENFKCPFCHVWMPPEMLDGRRDVVPVTKLSDINL